jgi:hypothetical protein
MTDQPAGVVPALTRENICFLINMYTQDIIECREQVALSKARREAAEKTVAAEKVIVRGLAGLILKTNITRDALLRDNLDAALCLVKDDKFYAIPEATAADRARCEADPTCKVIEYASISLLDRGRIIWVEPEDENPIE